MKRERIYLSPPHIGEEEFKNVKEAFDTNWIAPVGPHINQFELELQQYLGVPHCVVLTSGTAAIHFTLIILGVGRGMKWPALRSRLPVPVTLLCTRVPRLSSSIPKGKHGT